MGYICRLNPAIPEDAREEALRKVLRVATLSQAETNRAFHLQARCAVGVGPAGLLSSL